MTGETSINIECDKIGDVFYVRAMRNKQCLATGHDQVRQHAFNQCYLSLLHYGEDISFACLELLRKKDDGEVCAEEIPDVPGMPLSKLFAPKPQPYQPDFSLIGMTKCTFEDADCLPECMSPHTGPCPRRKW